MKIETIRNADKLTLVIEGRIDTKTSPELESLLMTSLEGVRELVFDFEKVTYISSAGLRVLMMAQMQMDQQGTMAVKNSSDDVMEIFTVTGFTEILTLV